MPSSDGAWLNNTVGSHWQKYRKRLKSCRHQASEDAVHKLRISTRRMLGLIKLLQLLTPHASLRKLRKSLKAQLDGFDELRDIQVMRLEISATVTDLPELAPFLHHLHVTEQRLLMQTPAFIQTLSKQKLRRKLKKAGARCRRSLNGANISDKVLTVIDTLYQKALERHQVVDPSQPATIHSLRISVKKLRYTLELAQTLITDLPANHLQALQTDLTRMGEIQNSAVLLDTLNNFFDTDVPDSVRQHYLARQHTQLNDYLAHKDDLRAFFGE